LFWFSAFVYRSGVWVVPWSNKSNLASRCNKSWKNGKDHSFAGLLLVEVVEFDKGVDSFFLRVKIVLLAAITGIGNEFSQVEVIKGFTLLKTVDVSGSIRSSLALFCLV
jgi:hypothetical protein